jgi:hypothetical protein
VPSLLESQVRAPRADKFRSDVWRSSPIGTISHNAKSGPKVDAWQSRAAPPDTLLMNRMVAALDDSEADLEELENFVNVYRRGIEHTLSKTAGLQRMAEKAKSAESRKLLERLVGKGKQKPTGLASPARTISRTYTERPLSGCGVRSRRRCGRLEYGDYWQTAKALQNVKVDVRQFMTAGEQERMLILLEAC